MYSTTYTAVIVNLLTTFLPLVGIQVGSDSLTTTIQTIVALVTGLWVLKERYAKGGVSVSGFKQ